MKTIDTANIEGYADMTPEQKVAALEAYQYEDNAAELERLKNANSKANSEAAEWKRKHNALLDEDGKKKLAEEEEKAAEAQKYADLEAKFNALTKKTTISEYTVKYLAQGYDEKLAKETAEALANGEMDKVFANGEKHKAALEAKIKAELMKSDPKPGAGDGDKNPNVEQAKAIGKAKAEANKTTVDVLSHYGIKT